MTDYLVDNSMWSRAINGHALLANRIRSIEASPSDSLVTCPPQVLEFCHSAPPGRYTEFRDLISLGFPLENHPEEPLVLDIQQALWTNGLHRAAGPVDILIAAYAILNNATVLACDHDFEHIASVTELMTEYVDPGEQAE
jgi:predicted nucleic acid-binding protein